MAANQQLKINRNHRIKITVISTIKKINNKFNCHQAIMNKITGPFLLLIFLTLLSGCINPQFKKNMPLAINGVIDCSKWNFQNDGPVELSGQWEFYWNQLLSPESISTNSVINKSYIRVPASWNSQYLHGTKLPVFGCATYRLTVKLPGNFTNSIGIKTEDINTAYNIFINKIFIGSKGKAGIDKESSIMGFKPKLYRIEYTNGVLEIVLQDSNFFDRLSGINNKILLGDYETLHWSWIKTILFDFFMLGSLTVMGLYYLGLFITRKFKEKSLFLFGLFCLLIGFRSIIAGERILVDFIRQMPASVYFRLELLTIYLGFPVYIMFIRSIFFQEFSANIFLIFQTIAAIFIIIMACPIQIYSYSLPIYHIFIIIGAIYVFYIILLAVKMKREGSIIILSGTIILFLFVLNDILYANKIIDSILVTQYGLLIYVFLMSFLLNVRFSRAFTAVENLSRSLKDYTENLEEKVLERTSELDEEKNKLLQQNQLMLDELELARVIQYQFIPKKSPGPNIGYFYKPMHQIGGDFYDFIQLPNSEKLGIFMSDVSGHGVPAALITSMLKSFILQAGDKLEDPADLLFYLNEMLLNQTAGNFITAFYCIYNKAKNNLFYANAGHYSPYMIEKENINSLSAANRGIPLGIMNNEELNKQNKLYRNVQISIQKGNKLIFFTDGLTETMNILNPELNFEEEKLRNILLAYKDFSPQNFVNRIYSDLVKFHGSDSFNDDVCIICLET